MAKAAEKSLAVLYREITARFAAAGIENAAGDARILLQAAADMTREDWAAGAAKLPDKNTEERVLSYAQRRISGEPVSRILGRRGFYKGEFLLSPDTLDPRPDTETLVETVLAQIADKNAKLRILDLGTGTGCIALSLLTELPLAEAVGTDIASGAIKTAEENAVLAGCDARCRFVVLDWKEAGEVAALGRFDIVVSNPPYIRSGDIPHLDREVRDHDPLRALDGGADGLDCYREILALLPSVLKPGGFCAFETGYDQAQEVAELCRTAGFVDISVAKDMGDRERCIFFRTKYQENA